MRSTSNPAFRNLPSGGFGGGYAGFQTQPQGATPGYGGYQAPPTTGERPITVDDVVTKTAATIGMALVTGFITAYLVLTETVNPFIPMIGGLIVGLVLSLIIIFKHMASGPMTLAYSAAEGVFLGAITGVFEYVMPGIALQAIVGTALVFVTMLVLYKTGAVKVTPKLTKWIIGATIGAAGLMLFNLLLSMLGLDIGLRSDTATPLAIGISLLFIGIAAFNFLLDFDMADQMIRAGMPSKWAWYAAFGLMTTLVWLYLEMLRLLYMLNSD